MQLSGICTVKRKGDRIVARCRLKTKDGGYLNLSTSVAVPPIADEIVAKLRANQVSPTMFIEGMHGDEEIDWESGFSWGDVWGGVKKAASAVAKNKAVENLVKIVNHPDIQKGIGLASTLFPPLGATYGAVSAATKLLDAAKGSAGPAKQAAAVAKLGIIKQGANQGAPAHMHVQALLRQLWTLVKSAAPFGQFPAAMMPAFAQQAAASPYARYAASPYGRYAPSPYAQRSPYARYAQPGPVARVINPWMFPRRSLRQQAYAAQARAYGRRRGLALVPAIGHHGADWNVDGWLYNNPYRSNLASALERNPGNVHRALYRQGLAANKRRHARK